ncbi:MAG: Leucine efflux protein [Paracidovorax wautersii]|uniref:Leucine efflux protein n=1 Tax=Paracidovorax wautersii TaxID=1177982 RepID=A0A7V8FQX6_9BURK|nr:MAG: Leucine efflux protein [Paracidovorax wautersii]
MFGIADYGAYVVAFIVFLMIPGPGNLAIVTSTGKGRIAGGLAATAGIVVGDQALIWAAVAGLAALLQASPLLFAAVQWLGAAYLAWLGVRMWRAAPGDKPVVNIQPGQYFRQSLLITLLNPKAIVFYMAFFPLFVDPRRHAGWEAFAVLAATAAALTVVYGMVATALAHVLAARLRASRRAVQWLNRLAGTLLVGFGVKLALSR